MACGEAWCKVYLEVLRQLIKARSREGGKEKGRSERGKEVIGMERGLERKEGKYSGS